MRSAESGTVVVADGFSCRTQVAHATDRTAMHLAELLTARFDAEEPLDR